MPGAAARKPRVEVELVLRRCRALGALACSALLSLAAHVTSRIGK
jgi:hypothetical protein